MKSRFNVLIALLFMLPLSFHAAEAEDEAYANFLNEFTWTKGPENAPIGKFGEIAIPSGMRFTGSTDTIEILKRTGNIPSGEELALMIHDAEDWWVLFEFDEIGYVKDDDKDELDADKMLKAIVEGNKKANEWKRDNNIPTFEIGGWQTPPHYDEASNNLEWGLILSADSGDSINYNTRLLGRHGVMEVTLICGDEELNAALPKFRDLLADYSYINGEKYAEYTEGDKVAKYGLAALILAGTAVGAAKLGLFGAIAVFAKKFLKFIVIGIVAVGAFFKKLFTSIFGGGRRDDEVDTY
ncbi:DUF2167 domain-containing protein [Verrucomicrobia bacterium]|nr:DUF2167 domain-containing protein [Verrucomicrobiota bacterium]